MATYFEQSLANLKRFEGCVPWMYLDTAGKVTVGSGTMLPTPEAASALPFEVAGSAVASAAIVAEFHRVAALPPGRLPAFYSQPSSPHLTMSCIDDRLRSVLVDFETDLRQHLPRYDRLPDPAKLALLDMAYNLGVVGLVHGYPHLMAAVAAENWTSAAAECLRHGISRERNSWTQIEFLAAATAIGVVTHIQASAATLKPLLRRLALGASAALLIWLTLRGARHVLGKRSARR